MISAHDWRDGIGDLCVADYLAELNEVHLVRHYTQFWMFGVISLEHLRARLQLRQSRDGFRIETTENKTPGGEH